MVGSQARGIPARMRVFTSANAISSTGSSRDLAALRGPSSVDGTDQSVPFQAVPGTREVGQAF